MIKVSDVFRYLCELAPLELQMDFDNSGFLLGHGDQDVSKLMLALDVTDEVIDEAIREGAELIVSHHPLIFQPLRTVTDESPEGRRVLKLIENRLSVISMHTNLDIAEGGVNDVLSAALGLQSPSPLDGNGCGRVGSLSERKSFQDFLSFVKETLRCNGLRYVDAERPVFRVAVMGGSGADSIERAALLGCDTYVTADIKYHQFQKALDLGINLIDADHFGTENPVVPMLAEKLGARFPEIRVLVSRAHGPIIRFG